MTASNPRRRREAAAVGGPGLLTSLRWALGFWRAGGGRGAWWLTAATLALAALQVLLQLALTRWIGGFFDALAVGERGALLGRAVAFTAILAAWMATAAYAIRARMMIQLRWRAWMTEQCAALWLQKRRHYLLQFFGGGSDNPDYRIAEDVRVVTEAAVDLAVGLSTSLLLLVSFLGVLWALSTPIEIDLGPLHLAIPGYLVGAAVIYAAAGSVLTYTLGWPMIRINEWRHSREGDFRFHLLRVRESSEAVALQHGEPAEQRRLRSALASLVAAARRLVRAQGRLTFVTSGYTAAAPIVPLLVAAPQFLSGAISLGDLMQASAAFVQIQLALGFFIDNFARLSDWRAALNRVGALVQRAEGLEAELVALDETSIEFKPSADDALRFADLRLESPDGLVVIDQAAAEFRPGEKVLLLGESGAGKTTLLKAIAGLWPWGRGLIEVPAGAPIQFVPQRPYFPFGSLRNALAYPQPSGRFETATLAAALTRVGLAHLLPRLDAIERWEQTLGDGEQQRFGFARLLVHRPRWILMDEATSALDDHEQAEMMTLLRAELPDSALISAGLRSGLREFHDRTVSLLRAPGGRRLVGGIIQRGGRGSN
ncbi:MAG: ABC transporter ATP-binding protein/permease [Alphaproteobacteria bacterium]|nr:ABC transporter ATP-binding protein/permease [Alphaproteobacteria bacterium]